MAKRVPNFQAGMHIARLEPFKSNTGSFRGEAGAPSSYGRLPHPEIEKMAGHNIDFTVMSYNTPIAVHHEEGWHYPDVSYSSTTSKHQAVTRGAIGVKSAREKKMEERAARKKAKADEQEKGLWES